MKGRGIYLDHAAATPVDRRVFAVMEPFFNERFYNPSADYGPSREVLGAVEEARRTVANYLGAKSTEIIFTAGGTEANNLAIKGIASKHSGGQIVTSAIEHDSVLEPIKHLSGKGWETVFVKPKNDGMVDAEDLLQATSDQTVLVSVMHSNGEAGTLQPINKIADGIRQIRRERQKRGLKRPIYFHSDACQSVNYMDVHVNRLGVDLMSINGGKIYGPKQSGVLFVKAGVEIEPMVFGGGQERGLRSGTENVPSIIGLAEAIKITEDIRSKEMERMKKLQAYFYSELPGLGNIKINGSTKRRLPNNVHVTFFGQDNERLLIKLDERGIYAAAGSACSAKKVASSHVLRAMGLNEEQARSSIRFSFGRETTKKDLKQVVQALRQLVVE